MGFSNHCILLLNFTQHPNLWDIASSKSSTSVHLFIQMEKYMVFFTDQGPEVL